MSYLPYDTPSVLVPILSIFLIVLHVHCVPVTIYMVRIFDFAFTGAVLLIHIGQCIVLRMWSAY